MPTGATTEPGDAVWGPAKGQPSMATRRRAVVAMWSEITAPASQRNVSSGDRPRDGELEVLAAFDVARLREAALAVHQGHGRLDGAQWVLECDWAGLAELVLTSAQIRSGDERAKRAGAELLLAGLGRSKPRDREVMRMRLGLAGEAMTLEQVGERYGLTRERIRQIQVRALKHAGVRVDNGVQRACDYARHQLRKALCPAGRDNPDPDLVLRLLELAVPNAPRDVATVLIAQLFGLTTDDRRDLAAAVETRHAELAEERHKRLRKERERGQLTAKVQQLFDKAEWPPNHDAAAGGVPTPLRPPIDENPRSKPGRWPAERLGRDVGYDSEAELRIIQLLEAVDDFVATFCEQPTRLAYTLHGRRSFYHPDLLVDLRDGRRVLVEVKSDISEFASEVNVAKFVAAIQYCHALGWGFLATTNRLQTPRDLLARAVDPAAENALRRRLRSGPFTWRQLRPLLRELGIGSTDVAGLALRHGWHLRTHPFRLSETPNPPAHAELT